MSHSRKAPCDWIARDPALPPPEKPAVRGRSHVTLLRTAAGSSRPALPEWHDQQVALLPRPSRSQSSVKMNAATAFRARMAASFVARRGFSTSRTQLASPYHYPEGPRSNIPFNPLTKFFFYRYWAFMITGFSAPFLIAVWQTYKTK